MKYLIKTNKDGNYQALGNNVIASFQGGGRQGGKDKKNVRIENVREDMRGKKYKEKKSEGKGYNGKI